MTFRQLAEYFQKLEKTSSRLAMTETLAQLFRQLSTDEIGKVCYLLLGRVAPLYVPLEFGVADKFMIRAIAHSSKVQTNQVEREFRKLGDLGSVAQELHKGKDASLSITNVFDALYLLTQTTGAGSQEEKINHIACVLSQVDSLSSRYITRITLGKLRLGFSDMTILDALSWMIAGDKSLHDELEAAYSVRPDIGWIAITVKSKGMAGFKDTKPVIGVPILPALCQRLPSADEMIVKMGEVGVEPKYDGVRVQIHYRKPAARRQKTLISTYSRNLENTTEMFPELANIGQFIKADSVILDAEAVGVDPKTGKILPFQKTTTRKRKHKIEEAILSVPLRFYIFDILYKNGEDLMGLPLSRRRQILLSTVVQGPMLAISPQIVTSQASSIRAYHTQQLAQGLEGVIVKRWNSAYEPGRRGFSWVKFKEEEGRSGKLTDTIDAVIMGYYRGRGKRSDFGIGAFLVGVKQADQFVTVTKIGTGVRDQMWKEMKIKLEDIKVNNKPKQYRDVEKMLIPDVWVSPEIVVEVAGDDLTKSPSHGAGYAIRFPRLVRIRSDKTPQQATSVEELRSLFQSQKISAAESVANSLKQT